MIHNPLVDNLLVALQVAWWVIVVNAGFGLVAHAVFFVAPDGRDAVLHDLGLFALMIRTTFWQTPITVRVSPKPETFDS